MEITFNLTSIESRKESLERTLESLSNQTVKARISLYLNYPHEYNYAHPFEGDMGDTGKFYSISNGWNLFVDDDIVYPKDYAERLIEYSDKFKCPVGVHGATFSKKTVRNYFNDRIVYPFWTRHNGTFVNVLGTGTLCFHSNLGFNKEFIDCPNMADCHFAVWCQERKIPLYCVPRPDRWLEPIHNEKSLWASRGKGEKQTQVINRVKAWTIYRVRIT